MNKEKELEDYNSLIKAVEKLANHTGKVVCVTQEKKENWEKLGLNTSSIDGCKIEVLKDDAFGLMKDICS